MQPLGKNKLQSFLQRTEGPAEINPHGLGSPPLHGVANATNAMSPPSPLGPKHDKVRKAEMMKVPLSLNKPASRSNGNMKPPGPASRINQSPSQRRPLEERNGWESAPPASLGPHMLQVQSDENEVGLRERWEEQSNMHSLFSESAPTINGHVKQDDDYEDEDDTRSDILDDRGRPRRGRYGHRSTDSLPTGVGRHRNYRKSTASPQIFNVGKNGNFITANVDPNKFSTSMITHAPRSSVPETAAFRQDPFASSENTSPLSRRGGAFLHSEFPHRGSDAVKNFSHVKQANFHQDAAKKLSPKKYDSATDAIHPHTLAKSLRVTSISDERQVPIQSIEHSPPADSDDDDSDLPSQGIDFEAQHNTQNMATQRFVQPDATIVFNPKPVTTQKSQKAVVLPPELLQASPMSRFIDQKSPSLKRPRGIDYDDTALQRMSFDELRNEPFDHDPTKEVPQSPAKPPVDNLSDRLKFYAGKNEDAQAQLFTQMSVRDWEDSGDWFLERFGDTVRRMKEARQAKRKMVENFETEVSSREEAVRLKKEGIDRKLSKLKNDSQAMMKDKELEE